MIMKVMCISEDFYNHFIESKPPIHPKIGEVLTVLGDSPLDADFYIIEEYPSNGIFARNATWRKCNFAPISDIDETELVKERELVNA
jgi:hypothetical protein